MKFSPKFKFPPKFAEFFAKFKFKAEFSPKFTKKAEFSAKFKFKAEFFAKFSAKAGFKKSKAAIKPLCKSLFIIANPPNSRFQHLQSRKNSRKAQKQSYARP